LGLRDASDWVRWSLKADPPLPIYHRTSRDVSERRPALADRKGIFKGGHALRLTAAGNGLQQLYVGFAQPRLVLDEVGGAARQAVTSAGGGHTVEAVYFFSGQQERIGRA